MPGRGPSPKAPEQRRRRNAPSGGEWIDLPPVPKPAKDKPLPALPKRPAHLGPWSARTRAAWAAWREDPATTQYTSGDVAAAIELAWLFEDCVRSPTSRLASEIRLRTDGLGLSAKGKRDLRWRASAPRHVAEIPDEVAVARARRQRVMAADPRSV